MRTTFRYKDTNSLFHIFTIFAVLFCRLNSSLNDNDYVFISIIALSGLGIILNLPKIRRFQLKYLVWIAGFLLLYILSSTWAVRKTTTYTNFIATLGRTITIYYLMTNMSTFDGVKKVIQIYLSAVLVNNLFILMVFGPGTLIEARVLDVVSQAGNSNTIGMSSAYAFILSYYLCRDEEKTSKSLKLAYVVLFALILLSGSKKALLIVIITVCLMTILTHRNKASAFCIAVLALLLGYILLINVPILYTMIGNRVESLMNGILSLRSIGDLSSADLMKSALNASDRTRFNMLIKGLQWFAEKPVLGHGMANYIVLYGSIASKAQYAHNNFIEIGVGMGIVGVLWYYSMYWNVLRTAKRNLKKSMLAKVALTLVVLQFVVDFGTVSYLESGAQIVLCIAYSITCAGMLQLEGEERN